MENDFARLIFLGFSQHYKPIHFMKKSSPSSLLLRLQLRGTCQVFLNEKLFLVAPGDLIFSKPGESYELQINAEPGDDGVTRIDSADYFLYCEGKWIERWIARNNFPDKVNIEINDDILSPWRRLIYEKRNLSDDNSELIEHLLKVLCLTVERSVRQRTTDSSRANLYIPYRIKRYVEQHVTEPITLAGIAKSHGISASTASHLFKRTFGYSIMRYVVEIRLSVASERILHSVVSLEEISEASGFHSYPYFCRAFRSRFHMPPSVYRKHHLRFGVAENSLYQP